MITRLFTEHPRSVNESYFRHLACACSYGLRMIGAGFACIVHGLLPFLFQDTGSKAIRALHSEITDRKAGGEPSLDC